MLDFSTAGLALLILRMPVLLLALTLHECAHAWTAERMGDPTARYMGRITLNPLHHLDLLGTLCLLLAPIGWAKPVPVNPLNFRNPGRDDILVSVAGPLSNLLQAAVFVLLLRLPWEGWIDLAGPARPESASTVGWMLQAPAGQKLLLALWLMLFMGVRMNIGLAVFNMLPFFPLDGHHVARENLRGEARDAFIRAQRLGPFIILALVLIDGNTPIRPISWPINWLTNWLFVHVGGF